MSPVNTWVDDPLWKSIGYIAKTMAIQHNTLQPTIQIMKTLNKILGAM